MNLQLRRFKPKSMPDRASILVVAKRNSGKSWLVRDLCYHKKHIPLGIVESGSEEGNHFYADFVPNSYVYAEYDRNVLQRLIVRQKKLAAQGKMSNVFVVLDDLMYDKSFLKESVIRFLFLNGRHLGVWLVCTAQYTGDVTPAVRTNMDYVFVLREPSVQNREKLWKQFFGIVPTFDLFCQLMDQCTENYECLVLDNTQRSNKIEDCLYYYKAEERSDFRMGHKKLWDHHKRIYNPDHDNVDEANQKIENMTRPSNKPKMRVKKVS